MTAAREQGAESLELRAATSLARFWRDHGKVQQARELLVTGGSLRASTRSIRRRRSAFEWTAMIGHAHANPSQLYVCAGVLPLAWVSNQQED